MKFELVRMYCRQDLPKKGIKITYDKTSKKRPAWIYVKGLPDTATVIGVNVNNKRIMYRTYLSPKTPMFIPTKFTPEELRKFYNVFSKFYDEHIKNNNPPAVDYLVKKIKLPKHIAILDLGAGTGIASSALVKAGYKNITLVDYSKNMLAKAKKKKELKNCTFKYANIKQFAPKQKYDLIISAFSFALDSYFDEKEMPALWKKVHSLLKSGGTLALLGHDYDPPTNLFKKLKTGTYYMDGVRDPHKWYVGRKK